MILINALTLINSSPLSSENNQLRFVLETPTFTNCPNFVARKPIIGHELRYLHTCDKFQRGIREVFLSFPGGF